MEYGEEVWVNLIVSCWELRWVMKWWREVGPCVQIIKMSSIYLFQVRGKRLFGAVDRRECSSFAKKRLAYDGAMRVPIAVPSVCR